MNGLPEVLTPKADVPATVNLSMRLAVISQLRDRLDHVYRKHGGHGWGRHEFYAILLEEVEELWDAIKTDEIPEVVESEALDVMVVLLRYLETRGVAP